MGQGAPAAAGHPRRFSVDWSDIIARNANRFLAHLRGKPDVHFIEIGCLEGRTTCLLLDGFLTHPTSTMTIIDPCRFGPRPDQQDVNADLERTILANIRPYRARVRFHKDYSYNVLPRLPAGAYDFAYVDGDHRRDAVYKDAVMVLRLIKVGGIIIFDDYFWRYDVKAQDRPDVPHDGIDRFIREYEPEVLSLPAPPTREVTRSFAPYLNDQVVVRRAR
jgi:predicted O-methyltransferase YrrM